MDRRGGRVGGAPRRRGGRLLLPERRAGPPGLHHDREEGPRAAPVTHPIGIAASRTGWTTFGPKRVNRSGCSVWTGITTPGSISRTISPISRSDMCPLAWYWYRRSL